MSKVFPLTLLIYCLPDETIYDRIFIEAERKSRLGRKVVDPLSPGYPERAHLGVPFSFSLVHPPGFNVLPVFYQRGLDSPLDQLKRSILFLVPTVNTPGHKIRQLNQWATLAINVCNREYTFCRSSAMDESVHGGHLGW